MSFARGFVFSINLQRVVFIELDSFSHTKKRCINFIPMIDVDKQIDYWTSSAKDDLVTAKILIEKERYLHGLFFCHLVIEKVLKAHAVKSTLRVAPKSHNLLYLLEHSKVEIKNDDDIFLGVLMKYQLKGRYPDYNPVIPKKNDVINYLVKTENLFKWLQEKL